MSVRFHQRGEYWYVRGTIRGPGKKSKRIHESTGQRTERDAKKVWPTREAELLDGLIYGERAVVRFVAAAQSYLESEPRSTRTKEIVNALIAAIGAKALGDIDQAVADVAAADICGKQSAPASRRRLVYGPLTAILNHAAARKWCDRPAFDMPAVGGTTPAFLTPAQAVALLNAAAPHLRELLLFLLGTGARLSEALELTWDRVSLSAAIARFDVTKSGRPRAASMPPAVVAMLANSPNKTGVVFRRDDGEPYETRGRYSGGQIKTGFRAACRRAGLMRQRIDAAGQPVTRNGEPVMEPIVTPHDLRHTWATWAYALTKDPMLVKTEGCWASIAMVERYAHLMPDELVPDIAAIWGPSHPRFGAVPVRSPSGANPAHGELPTVTSAYNLR